MVLPPYWPYRLNFCWFLLVTWALITWVAPGSMLRPLLFPIHSQHPGFSWSLASLVTYTLRNPTWLSPTCLTPLNSSCLFNISNWTSNKLLECAISRIQFLITPTHLLLPESSSQKQVQLLPSRCLNQNPHSHFGLFLTRHIPSISESYWRPLEDTFGIRLLLPYLYGLSPHHLNYLNSLLTGLSAFSLAPKSILNTIATHIGTRRLSEQIPPMICQLTQNKAKALENNKLYQPLTPPASHVLPLGLHSCCPHPSGPPSPWTLLALSGSSQEELCSSHGSSHGSLHHFLQVLTKCDVYPPYAPYFKSWSPSQQFSFSLPNFFSLVIITIRHSLYIFHLGSCLLCPIMAEIFIFFNTMSSTLRTLPGMYLEAGKYLMDIRMPKQPGVGKLDPWFLNFLKQIMCH